VLAGPILQILQSDHFRLTWGFDHLGAAFKILAGVLRRPPALSRGSRTAARKVALSIKMTKLERLSLPLS
jgi:hypothetical protein